MRLGGYMLLVILGLALAEHVAGQMDPKINCTIRADVAFVLDGSGSIGKANWLRVLAFVKGMIKKIHIGKDKQGREMNRVGVVTFGNQGTVNIKLNQYSDKNLLLAAIDKVQWKDQNTNTSGGLRVMREQIFNKLNGDRPTAPNVAIVLTDGASTRDSKQTIPEANKARLAGAKLFAIGVGNKLNKQELMGIANDPDSHYMFIVDDFNKLLAESHKILSAFCSEPPTTTAKPPTTPSRPDVIPDVTGCRKKDIAFVLDVSGSIGKANMNRMLRFVKDLVSSIPISATTNQVGMVSYSLGSHVEFTLDRYRSVRDIQEAVGSVQWGNSWTNTAGALNMMRNAIFGSREDRADAPNVAIIITDGHSNNNTDKLPGEITATKKGGITMYAVGVGDVVNMKEIRMLASSPDYFYAFIAKDFQDLVTRVRTKLLAHFCKVTKPTPSVKPGPIVWSCNFENAQGVSTMCEATQDKNDQLDWTIHKGPTPSKETGPNAAQSGSYYLYIEASNGKNGDSAYLMLPRKSNMPDGVYCLTFYYNMYGFHSGGLQVISRRPGATEDLLWTMHGQKGRHWIKGAATLSLKTNEQIGIRGIRGTGFSGDIGIDTFSLRKGSC